MLQTPQLAKSDVKTPLRVDRRGIEVSWSLLRLFETSQYKETFCNNHQSSFSCAQQKWSQLFHSSHWTTFVWTWRCKSLSGHWIWSHVRESWLQPFQAPSLIAAVLNSRVVVTGKAILERVSFYNLMRESHDREKKCVLLGPLSDQSA